MPAGRNTKRMQRSWKVLLKHFGEGPFSCYFCDVLIENFWKVRYYRTPTAPVVHHIDGNHENDHPSNLAPAHHGCHGRYHQKGKPKNYKVEYNAKLRARRLTTRYSTRRD